MERVQMQKWVGEGTARHYEFQTVVIAEAFKGDGPYRWPECEKPVRLHKASAKHTAHAEHRVGDEACSLSQKSKQARRKTGKTPG